MKKRLIALALVLALCASVATAWAAAGGAEDPLISLSYLTTTYKSALSQALQNALTPSTSSGQQSSAQITMAQERYKQGDIISAAEGCEVIVLAGSVSARCSEGGVLVDATGGSELASGATLSVNSRYLVGEDTQCDLTITSLTAVVCVNGPSSFTASTKPDYNAMASALKALSLFKGTGSGIGDGYDLELRPTRIEAIVLFIRILGEEDAALACTAADPFSDVPTWADRYVAYAYQQGYSNGIGNGRFGSSLTISAREYVEFMMRALGYSSTSHTDLSTTLSDAKAAGVLTAGEYSALTTETLLRAHLAYLSYYALTTPMADGSGTLEDSLLRRGLFDQSTLSQAHSLVTTARL